MMSFGILEEFGRAVIQTDVIVVTPGAGTIPQC
jgi:hypothetical protein